MFTHVIGLSPKVTKTNLKDDSGSAKHAIVPFKRARQRDISRKFRPLGQMWISDLDYWPLIHTIFTTVRKAHLQQGVLRGFNGAS